MPTYGVLGSGLCFLLDGCGSDTQQTSSRYSPVGRDRRGLLLALIS
jgi:hypothetical protein